MKLERPDDYQTRRAHLAGLTDDELKARFWSLADQITDPLIDLARTHTTPSIERSIAMRMGFTSLEAQALISGLTEHGILGHGVGRAVINVMQSRNVDTREAGRMLINGECWDIAKGGAA